MERVQNERHVIIKRARETRLTLVKQGTTGSAGKLKFDFNDLIGRQFGIPYKVDRKRLQACTPADLQLTELDNEDDDAADDEKMEDGATGSEIVTKLAMGNASFRQKTAYAKEKYLRKKDKKYSSIITVYPPSIRLIHEIYYNKDADKIAYLRQDCLAHLLTWSNVHHGCRIAVVEQCLGIVTAAVLERMAGGGQCVRLHKGTALQSIPCLSAMDFDESTLAPLLPIPLAEFLNPEAGASGDGVEETDVKMEENEEKKRTNGADELRAARREQRAAQKAVGLQVLQEGKLDSFIMAVKEHPLPLMKRLLQSTLPSRPFVIYAPCVQVCTTG